MQTVVNDKPDPAWIETKRLLKSLWPKATYTEAEAALWTERLAFRRRQDLVQQGLRNYCAEKIRRTPKLPEVLRYVRELEPAPERYGATRTTAAAPPEPEGETFGMGEWIDRGGGAFFASLLADRRKGLSDAPR